MLQLALLRAAEREACSAAAPSVPALQNLNVIGVTLFGEKNTNKPGVPYLYPQRGGKKKPNPTRKRFRKTVPTATLACHNAGSSFVALYLGLLVPPKAPGS